MDIDTLGWLVALVVCVALTLTLRYVQALRARLAPAPSPAKTAAWSETASAFQKAYADAKERAETVEPPSCCVYSDCDEAPTSSIVDSKGIATGLCDRHARTWAKLDEDGRRRVRTGASS